MTRRNPSLSPDPLVSEDPYFLEIEAHFAERRGTPFVFSGKDWSLMKGWKDQGIPLPIVIEAIDACFDKRVASPRKRIISSLAYCRHAVVELWDERKDLLVGKRAVVPEGETGTEIETLARELDACVEQHDEHAVREAILGAVMHVRAIRPAESLQAIESKLMEIEESLLAGLERALPDPVRGDLYGAIDEELGRHRFSDDATRNRTRRASIRRHLREALGLPRLSLFR